MQGLQKAVAELGDLKLPEGVELIEAISSDSRAVTFKARYRAETVALKIYRPDVVRKYRKKYDVNIAVHEMSENRKFRKNQTLFPYSAKPIMVMGHDGKVTLCFMQELIEGTPLTDLARRENGLPESVLEAGEIIARAAEQQGFDSLDLDYRRVSLRKQAGKWLPVFFDFGQPPGGTASARGLAGLLGRGKARPPMQAIQQWRKFSEQCSRNNG